MMLVILIAVQLIAIAITQPIKESFERGDVPPPISESTSSTEISNDIIIFMIVIMAYTALLILAAKLKNPWLLNGLILLSMGICIDYVLMIYLPEINYLPETANTPLIALISTFALLLLMKMYPRWYVIDLICIMICAGISTIYGINMNIYTAIFLLIIMAIYDIISVYKTRHMEYLAQAMIRIKAPLIFVLPRSKSHSPGRHNDSAQSDDGKMTPPFFLGLGDAIIPTMLVVSVYHNNVGPLPMLGAMLGTYLGFIILMTALSDRMHAGLPFLNGGAILGYFLGCILS